MSTKERLIGYILLALMGLWMGMAMADVMMHVYRHAELVDTYRIFMLAPLVWFVVYLGAKFYSKAETAIIVMATAIPFSLALIDIKSYLSLALIHSALAYHVYKLHRDIPDDP